MNNITSSIMITASNLQLGEQLRTNCPFCGSTDNTFSIARTDDGCTVWHCFRASCKQRGKRGSGNLVHTRLRPSKPRKLNPYRGTLQRCNTKEAKYLHETLGWTATHRDIANPLFAPDINRYAYPIYDPVGLRRGHVLRSYDKDAYTKALTHMDKDEPHMSWYRTHPQLPMVVVVEDIPSAVRVALYTNAVALCGTGCSYNYALEIAAHAKHVVWALDADALAISIKLQRKHKLLFNESSILSIDMDFKDMTEARVKETLECLTPT